MNKQDTQIKALLETIESQKKTHDVLIKKLQDINDLLKPIEGLQEAIEYVTDDMVFCMNDDGSQKAASKSYEMMNLLRAAKRFLVMQEKVKHTPRPPVEASAAADLNQRDEPHDYVARGD